ncbi:MAG: phospho-N-acetylmuramoyl-pentapeptide-transferase [Deltaproteobacteria bacterium]|nr:phospho-N-acetylmuramoyl-pentapeptide-transferase [Deltaproteobacteria bacterium]
MLADLLYAIWPYQIFKSLLFRSGMSFLTTYFLIVLLMHPLIRWFRAAGVVSDFGTQENQPKRPYAGPKPIMGGGLLILGILVSMVLWVELNQFAVALMVIMVAFAAIGAIDDLQKVRHRRHVEGGTAEKKEYTDKADGISGTTRLSLEFLLATAVVIGLYWYVTIDGHLVIPFIPLKWWYPYLPRHLFIPLMVVIIVAGANAVNLTDGMDSLATVPIITCTAFVAAVAYVGSEPEWVLRLKLPVLPVEIREVVVVAAAVISAGIAFLRYNAPPAMITMGDMGALAMGSVMSTMFILAKVELFLPLAGGVFVLTTLSTIIQRLFFKLMVNVKGREFAKQVRFFYRAPYHHHLQALWTYGEEVKKVRSIWVEIQRRLGVRLPGPEDQLTRAADVDSRVVWRLHMVSLWLLVVSLLVYFKVR